jgi:uncharacterized RDD family membrane protein YckC
MRLPYKAFIIINLVVLAGFAWFAFRVCQQAFNFSLEPEAFLWTAAIIFITLVLIYSPLMIFLKSRTRGFEGLRLKQLIFAAHPAATAHLPAFLKNYRSIFSEKKDPTAASPLKRVAAYLIDIAPLFIIVAFFVGIAAALNFEVYNLPPVEKIIFIIALSTSLIVFLIYLFIRDGFNGQSLGKRILKIQVVDFETRRPIGTGKSALRYLFLRLLSVLEFGILMVTPNHRRFGDWAAKTIVINIQNIPLPTLPPQR